MKRKTVGPSPKLIAAVIAAVATYLVTQQVLALPAWAVVLCQAVVVAVAAFAAPPGNVVAVEASHRDSRGRFTALAPLGLLAAAHGHLDAGLLFVLLAVLFVLGALYLAVRLGEYVGAVVCVVLAILVLAFLA